MHRGRWVGAWVFESAAINGREVCQHPFSEDSKARVYKTGDLARYRPDGIIEFIGRADNKLRSAAIVIELGEIETALMQYPDVQSVAVLARQDTPGEKKLVAYIVSQRRGCPDCRTANIFAAEASALHAAICFCDAECPTALAQRQS